MTAPLLRLGAPASLRVYQAEALDQLDAAVRAGYRAPLLVA